MGNIQVSKVQPINFQPPFLVLFINQLNSPKVSWAFIALGLGEYGKSSFLAGLSSLTTCLTKGKVFPISLTWKRAARTPLMHSHAGMNVSSSTHVAELPHVFGLLCVFPHLGSRFIQFPQVGNSFLVMISGWVSSPTIWLHFPIVFQDGNHFLARPASGGDRRFFWVLLSPFWPC